MNPALVIIAVAALVAANCALVGSFLVLRKMALLGDAISHAVLPGIVIAFLATGSRAPLPMILGAGALGVLTVFLVALFQRSERLREDASIGVVFPALFSLGVILISRYAAQVDLDLDCVLYGEIAYTPWDTISWGVRSLGPKALWVGGGMLLANLGFVLGLWKELELTSFDPELSASLGFRPVLMHYLLMSAVAATVVASFESVGAVLVVALLVVPPATAFLLTDRLPRMIALAVGLGVLGSALGYGLARVLDCSIAGAIGFVCGLQFLAAFLLSPSHGYLRVRRRHRALHRDFDERLVLLHVDDGFGSAQELARRLGWRSERVARSLAQLRERRWIDDSAEGRLATTPEGRVVLAGPLDAPVSGLSQPSL